MFVRAVAASPRGVAARGRGQRQRLVLNTHPGFGHRASICAAGRQKERPHSKQKLCQFKLCKFKLGKVFFVRLPKEFGERRENNERGLKSATFNHASTGVGKVGAESVSLFLICSQSNNGCNARARTWTVKEKNANTTGKLIDNQLRRHWEHSLRSFQGIFLIYRTSWVSLSFQFICSTNERKTHASEI